MNDAASARDAVVQAGAKSLEAMSLWAETSERLMRELVELGTGTAKEGIRLLGEMQRGGIEAAREGQGAMLRWQKDWKDALADPATWYRAAVAETVAGAQQAFRAAEESALAVARSAERMQAAGEAAGKGIQDACSSAVARLKEIYATV